MPNKKSIFRYKIQGKDECCERIAETIDEELNRGLSFVISATDERIVHIAGKRKKWVTSFADRDRIYVHINDDFFINHCILNQILTTLWMDLFDFCEIQLEEFCLSKNIHSLLSTETICDVPGQELLNAKGPYFGTIFKPPFCLSFKQKIDIAKKFASLGGDFIKEDETHVVNEDKLIKNSRDIQKGMNTFSDHCFYVPNVSPYIYNPEILQELHRVGIRVVMVNYLVTGLPTVYNVRKDNKNLLFWGHRVGYRLLEKHISMKAMASLAAYCGINMIHVGTPFLSIQNNIEECTCILRAIKSINDKTLPVFTKASLRIIPKLIEFFGRNVIIMTCGDIRTNGHLDWEKIKKWSEVLRSE